MTRKPYILFQTDFGMWGGASMYGMCKIVDPSLQAGELSHTVPTFNVAEASRRLARTLPFWPEGTIFVSVVDPGVGTPRRACVARTANGYYVTTPDNGTLADLHARYGVVEIREIDERVNRYPHTPKVSIFHGRDLFAYCAARLASGIISYEGVGAAYPVGEIITETGVARDSARDINREDAWESEFMQRASILTAACEKNSPSSVVIVNDFNHNGGLAILRGACKRVCFDVNVYDMPVSPEEMQHAADIIQTVRPYWPEGTMFVAAENAGKLRILF